MIRVIFVGFTAQGVDYVRRKEGLLPHEALRVGSGLHLEGYRAPGAEVRYHEGTSRRVSAETLSYIDRRLDLMRAFGAL